MKTRKSKEAEIELTKENWEALEGVSRKTGLKMEKIVDMILGCEMATIMYAVSERKKLAKRLKIRATRRFLYRQSI